MNLHKVTPEIAYTLGFIWGDGYITDKTRIGISIKKSDAIILEPTFMKAWNWNIRKDIIKKNPKGEMQYNFHKRDVKLSQKLIEYKYKSKNEAPTILSIIPDKLKHYWWRGYSDADGCFCITKDKRYRFSICGPYNQDWSFVENLFRSLGITYSIRREVYLKTNYTSSRIIITNRQGSKTIGNYIYRGYPEDKIGLKRKYEKYMQF